MKKLLAITALTVLTASSAFATTSHQAWRGQALQSYASSDELVSSSRDSATSPYGVVSPYGAVMSSSRDSATSPYFGYGYGFGPQTTGSSIVQ